MRITERQLKRIIREAVELSGRLSVERSPIHGVGVFAQTHIPADTDLGPAQIRQPGGRHDVTQLGKKHNHSESPSCRNQLMGNERHLITKQDMLPGDEVTVDYRLQPELEQPQPGWI